MIKRRQFLGTFAGATVAATPPQPLWPASPATAQGRMNLLSITADDLNADPVAWVGCNTGTTPCHDAFARTDRGFARAHSAAPICQPSLEAVMTGQVPHRSGGLDFNPMRPDVVPSLWESRHKFRKSAGCGNFRPLVFLLLCAAGARDGNLLAQQPPAPLPQGNHGIAAKHPGDRGIEQDPDVIFHDDFENGKVSDKWSNYYQQHLTTYTTEPANVHAGKRALEFTVPKQQAELSNGVDKELKGYDVVFLRYYSKFDKGFDQVGSSHNGGFLAAQTPDLAYSNPGLVANGKNKFQASFENWRGTATDKSPGLMNVYVYHPAQRSQWGDHFFPNGEVSPNTSLPGDFGPHFTPRPQFTPELDRWYCYELMLKANTPGQRDGRIGCWVDGKLIADFPNLRFRDVVTLKIMRASLDLHIRNNTVRENKKWYDDVVIATSYVGPMAAQAGNASPGLSADAPAKPAR